MRKHSRFMLALLGSLFVIPALHAQDRVVPPDRPANGSTLKEQAKPIFDDSNKSGVQCPVPDICGRCDCPKEPTPGNLKRK